jgi:hypothetical protein
MTLEQGLELETGTRNSSSFNIALSRVILLIQ